MSKSTRVLSLLVFSLVANSANAFDVQNVFNELLDYAPQVRHAQLVVDEVMRYPTFSYVIEEGCEIHVGTSFVKSYSAEIVAFLLAHELGHCQMQHQRQRANAPLVEHRRLSWQAEYEADLFGLILARDAGYELTVPEFRELMTRFPGGGSHPTAQARLNALKGRGREYPSMVNQEGLQAANTIFVQDGKVVLGRR